MARATGPLYSVHFKRRREGKTDYAKRLAFVKSGKPRLVVRKTNRFIIAQITSWGEKGDSTLASVTSKALNAFGFNGKANTPSAYLTGLLCGVKAKAKGVGEIVLDVGLHSPTKGSVVFAVLKGAVDAGLKANFGQEKMPSEERLSGKHLGSDAQFAQAKQKILAGVKA
ncbi:MAG: 50S ribosomal protein L18 [Candidatus Norongarragalinales archaeon]